MTTLRSAWDEQAENWIRYARTPDHDTFFWRLGLPRLLELLPPPGRLTVDLGCGEGRLTRALRDRGYRAVGVEPSLALARAAATHGEATPVIAADAAALPVKAHAADLVVAYMVLQDVDDLDGVVREAARVLGGGGRFVAAFVHPMQTTGDFVEPVVDGVPATSGPSGATFVARHSYFEPRRVTDAIDRDGIPMTFHMEHRPIERYMRAFEDAGLLVEAVREPVPDAEVLEAIPRNERFARVPWAMFVRAIRSLWAAK